MSRKNGVILKALAVLAIAWAAVWVVRSYASERKTTAAGVERELQALHIADWSETPGSAAERKRREGEIRRISDMYNRLDFAEREKNRDNRAAEDFFKKLSRPEKELFIDLTIVESMGRFMEALDKMPPEERKRFVEKGLQQIQEGRTEAEMERAAEMDDQLLTKISGEGMRAYFDKASADTKLDLAPLMDAMNGVMQGLRGRDFGQ